MTTLVDHTVLLQLVLRPCSGACGPQALSLFREVENHIRSVTGDPLSFTYLMQRIAAACNSVRQRHVHHEFDDP